MKHVLMRSLFATVLSVSAAFSDETSGSKASPAPKFEGIWTVHQVQILILVDAGLLQMTAPHHDHSQSLGDALKDPVEVPAAVRPLLSELTIENTEAKLIESLQNELGKIGVQVTSVTVQSYPGLAKEREALADAAVAAPHSSAMIVVEPKFVLSENYRTLLLFASIDVFAPDSEQLLLASGYCCGPKDAIDGSDPLAQWSAENGARFFRDLNAGEVELAANLADTIRTSDPKLRKTPPPPPPPPQATGQILH